MVTATRLGERYCVQVSNGQSAVLSDTQKEGKGGQAGMRPHELLESALAACICMSIDIAAERASAVLPAITVQVTIDRKDDETSFDVSLHFSETPSPEQQELVTEAARTSPVARTLSKPIRIRPAAIVAT